MAKTETEKQRGIVVMILFFLIIVGVVVAALLFVMQKQRKAEGKETQINIQSQINL